MSDGVGKLCTIRHSPIKCIYQCVLWFHIETKFSIAEPIGAMINSSYVKQSASSRLELWDTDFFPLWKQEPLVHCICGACVVDWFRSFIVH